MYDLAMTTTIELTSTGQLSQLLQRHPSEIRTACEELGILPSYRLNSVSYYSVQDCRQLTEYFRRQQPQGEKNQ